MNARIVSNMTAAALICLVAAACAPRTTDMDDRLDPVVFTDRATGCEYLATRQRNALTPRLSADGKQVCNAIAHAEGGAK